MVYKIKHQVINVDDEKLNTNFEYVLGKIQDISLA